MSNLSETFSFKLDKPLKDHLDGKDNPSRYLRELLSADLGREAYIRLYLKGDANKEQIKKALVDEMVDDLERQVDQVLEIPHLLDPPEKWD